jgi:hypothetical protein
MTYKKYIKRDGKLYGPYLYESHRDENGKVINKYVSKGDDAGSENSAPPAENAPAPSSNLPSKDVPMRMFLLHAMRFLFLFLLRAILLPMRLVLLSCQENGSFLHCLFLC